MSTRDQGTKDKIGENVVEALLEDGTKGSEILTAKTADFHAAAIRGTIAIIREGVARKAEIDADAKHTLKRLKAEIDDFISQLAESLKVQVDEAPTIDEAKKAIDNYVTLQTIISKEEIEAYHIQLAERLNADDDYVRRQAEISKVEIETGVSQLAESLKVQVDEALTKDDAKKAIDYYISQLAESLKSQVDVLISQQKELGKSEIDAVTKKRIIELKNAIPAAAQQ